MTSGGLKGFLTGGLQGIKVNYSLEENVRQINGLPVDRFRTTYDLSQQGDEALQEEVLFLDFPLHILFFQFLGPYGLSSKQLVLF